MKTKGVVTISGIYSIVIYFVVGILGGGGIATSLYRFSSRSLLAKAREKLARADEEIKSKRREFELEKREELHRLRAIFEKETLEKTGELHQLSKRLIEREEKVDRHLQELENKRKEFIDREDKIKVRENQIEETKVKWLREMERIAGISVQEARRNLLETIKKEAREEASQIIQKVERETKEIAAKKARMIIATAIQRCAVDEASDSVISTVSLPNDEMKGRVIGREGRNIRTFEALTGVDLIVDDTPETVVISCFDPLRRKIAQVSLERLIADSRIHPGRIEEIVEKAKKDVEELIREEGQRTVFDMGISNLSSELVNLLGKLKFRTSYGQNVLEHSKEVAYIANIMASEIGLDAGMAKRAGLLHDIGKAVDQEMEGPHALIGAHLAKRFGECSNVVHAIAAHHEDKVAETTLAAIIQASDAISASRPGARKEVLEAYVKRLELLEKVANSFSEVDRSYAIQAGREIRIIVQPERVNDYTAGELAKEIAIKIEKELHYPGQIKITVIRELRAIEYAK